MAAVNFIQRGMTPRQFHNEMRNLARNTRRRLIEQPATTLGGRGRNGISTVVANDVGRVVAVAKAFLRDRKSIDSRTFKGASKAGVVTTIKSRGIPISRLRPNYKAGKEAGIGDRYGRGTSYTLYRGKRETAPTVFQRPTVARGEDESKAYITRVKGAGRNPKRWWRGLTLSNYYRNSRGKTHLPGLKRAIVSRVKHVMKLASARILGRSR